MPATEIEPEVDFVLPVFNEGANIARVLSEIERNVALPKRVLVVHDTIDDDTLPVLRALADQYPWAQATRNEFGPGVLNALRWGISRARAPIVVISMADLSDDLSVVPRMVELIERDGFDVVCASRYMRGGRQIGGPWLKGLLSRCAGVSLHLLAGVPSHDATNAFRAYRRTALEQLEIESRAGFSVSLELLAKAFGRGMRITEVPATWRDRTAGKSRFRLWAWLPEYLKWYVYALTHRPKRERNRSAE